MTNDIDKTAKIFYIEIPAPDINKGKQFYSSVFNWDISDSNLGDSPYAMFQGAGIDGALDTSKQASDKGVLLYLKVEDIPTKLGEIEKAGGHIVKTKTRVIENTDEYGFMALFNDPNGNRLGLWAKT